MDSRWAVPLMLVTMIVVLLLLLRWTFSHGRSLVSRPRDPGPPSGRRAPAHPDALEFTPVRVVPTFIEAEMMRLELRSAGIEAELGRRGEAATVLVRARDLRRAAELLAGYPG